ncbi:MAG: hypothetical protein DRP25_06105 [Thermotoga sp.]|nr:MAG: hypothetical protein DRP25_06105 [Thermotoga sp.]
MGNALIVSLVIASAFIAGVILMNYLARNLPYEEPSAVYMEKLDVPADLFLDMDQDGSPEHFYLFFGRKNEIKIIFEGDMIDRIPAFSDKCEVFLVKDDVPKVYIKLSGEKTEHIIFWKPGKHLLKVEFYADDLKWITSSTLEITSQGRRYSYLLLDKPPFFTSESTETIEFLMKEYK